MSIPSEYSFTRYLAAKKSVDDRALNSHVLGALVKYLSSGSRQPQRWLEIGAGTGSMVERLLDWNVLRQAEYTAIDADDANIRAACASLPAWAEARGFSVACLQSGEFLFTRNEQRVQVVFKTLDLFDLLSGQAQAGPQDVLVAHAFLDLIDIPRHLPDVLGLLKPGGAYYFTINFDGQTLLEPAIDRQFDDLVQSLYHQTMDQRLTGGLPSGDSRTGRHLFANLRQAGAEILDAGASDWVVFATDGSYPQDEAYFLHFIVHTIWEALRGHPDLDAGQFRRWIARRHEQIEGGELVYIAHQLDFTGRLKGGG